MSTAHLDPFLHYPKTTATGLTLIGIAGALFIAATLKLTENEARVANDIAGILVIVSMWLFLITGALVERRKKYAAILVLIFGLFLLCITATLPYLVEDLLSALVGN
jgi:hypothetical protein